MNRYTGPAYRTYPALAKMLRRQGFKLKFNTVAGGERCVCYAKTVDDRMVEVQLWGLGNHRVSHMLNGRGTTTPTNFSTEEEMLAAIRHELTRTDHKPRPESTSN